MKENTKPFVRIQSSITIRVTAGLQYEDVTNADAHVADRLKINSMWTQGMCVVEKGTHVYPSEITSWPTVKALVKDGLFTIGEYLDEADEKVQEKKSDLETFIAKEKELIAPKQEKKASKLADIAGDEE